jgi:hypothetical protein
MGMEGQGKSGKILGQTGKVREKSGARAIGQQRAPGMLSINE